EGPFTAAEASGGFTIAGGVLRSGNLAIEGEEARLVGSTTLRLADLGLEGSYTMTATRPLASEPGTRAIPAQVAARLGGTLLAPEAQYDVAALVDALTVQAYE